MAILDCDCEGYLPLMRMIVFVVELWYVTIVSSVLSMIPEMRMKSFMVSWAVLLQATLKNGLFARLLR